MPSAAAEPGPVPPDSAPGGDGRVPSAPMAVLNTPDGWTLALAAKDETQVANAPLTTALSSREYVVGGTFDGTLRGPADPEEPIGTMEVGYQIGCGIDMSTSNGVSLTGTTGISPSVGFAGVDVASPLPEGLIPVVTTPVTGGVTVGLKPGIINVVPVTKKDFSGFDPWVMISNFHVKIDGCVGQSFIRSYAFLTRSTKSSDAILAWYGITTVV
nr:MspA family porin [Mycolicibacterium sediminis]